MSEEIRGDIFCPKCGFKFSVHKGRKMECNVCGKNMYGEYPRIHLVLAPNLYTKQEKCGYVCSSCAKKYGLFPKE